MIALNDLHIVPQWIYDCIGKFSVDLSHDRLIVLATMLLVIST